MLGWAAIRPTTDRVTAKLNKKKTAFFIDTATAADLESIVALDARITGSEKSGYWEDMLEQLSGAGSSAERYFLVARSREELLIGFIVGEIRAWEFGSPPCGWVLALGVTPDQREQGIGTLLLDALCDQMKKNGVSTIRTMVLGSDKVNLSFFRGEGLAAGPYIELERRLD
jgi:ribosomal protein S18 acetylase RimI-like enzyme